MKRYLLLAFIFLLLPLLSNAQDTIPTSPAIDSTQSNSMKIQISEPIGGVSASDSITKTISGNPPAITPCSGPNIFPMVERIISSEAIGITPDANMISLISATNGVVNGNGSLYFRGSRSDEIAYFIDGFNVTEQYTGKMATPINLAAIEELSINTGGWGAEIGDAMGGLVNIKTKEYPRKFNVFSKLTAEPSRNNNKIETAFGGALPYKNVISYSFSAETDNGDDIRPCFMPDQYYVHDPSKDYLWTDTLRFTDSQWDSNSADTLPDRWVGGWMDSTDEAWQAEKEKRMADGWVRGWKESDDGYLPHSDYNKYSFSGKINYKIEPLNAKMGLLGVANRNQNAEYSSSGKYNLEGYYSSLQKSSLLGLTWEHNIFDKINYVLKISRHHSQTQLGIRDTVAEKNRNWWEDYTFLSDDDADGDSMYDAYEGQVYDNTGIDNPFGVSGIFFTNGLARIWEKTFSDRNTQKLDIRSEYIKNNRISAGFEFNQHHVYKKYNSLPWSQLPIKEFYEYEPKTGSYYFQDAFTYNRFFIAAGLRFDHVDLGDYFKSKYYYLENKTLKYEQEKLAASLRSNIGYLLTPSTSFLFGFNQYKSLPSWDMLYNAYLPWFYSMPLLVDFQRTTSYELDITNQITRALTINTSAYYKNIHNVLQASIAADSSTGILYTKYSYADYGTAKGLELGIKYNLEYLSGNFNYNYSKTSCEQSIPVFDNPGTIIDESTITYIKYPFNYDQTNKFNIVTNFNSGNHFGPRLAGFYPLSDITIGLTNDMGTGFPYSKTDSKGVTIGNINSSRLPTYWYTNLLISKKINFHKITMSLTFEALNLFNRKSVASIYQATGLADDDGKIISLGDFDPTPYRDSLIASYYGDVNGDGDPNDTLKVPNPYYSRWADLNQDGMIDQNEKYLAYVKAWNDFISDPFNSLRVPYDRAYLEPRRFKLSLSISF